MRQRNYTHQIKSHKNVAWFFVFFFSVCSSAHASHIVRAPFHFPASRVQTQEFSHYDYVARYALYNTLYNNPFQHFSYFLFRGFFYLGFSSNSLSRRDVFLCNFFPLPLDIALIPKFCTIYLVTHLKIIYTILHGHSPQVPVMCVFALKV